jgi:hypothetical protein
VARIRGIQVGQASLSEPGGYAFFHAKIGSGGLRDVCIELIAWIVGLALRIGLRRSLEPRCKSLFLGYLYLGLTLLLAVGICFLAFNPSAQWIGVISPWVIAWILVSTLAMFTVPLRLTLIPNAYIVAWIFYSVGSFASLEYGNEPSIPNVETMLFGIILLSGSIGSLCCLKKWWQSI